LAALLAIGSFSPSLACKGPKVIYSDDFTERDAGWFIPQSDIDAGKAAVGDGRILVRPDPERGYSVLNMAFGLPTQTDICVKARIVESSDLTKSAFGLLFWAKGYDEYYLFQVIGNANYYVSHWTERAWQSVTPTAAVPSAAILPLQPSHRPPCDFIAASTPTASPPAAFVDSVTRFDTATSRVMGPPPTAGSAGSRS